MEVSNWEIAVGLVCFLVLSPPIYAYDITSRAYKKYARALKANIPLSKAAELKRQAREEANRSHGFMRLPGELRNRIYSLCMISKAVIDPVWGAIYELNQIDGKESSLDKSSIFPEYVSQLCSNHDAPYHDTRTRWANMSQVCKTWRVEAVKYFYGNNAIKLPTGKHLHERTHLEQRADSARQRRYLIWPVWRGLYWHRNVVGPAGRFASRHHYSSWLQRCPKEGLAVTRLVLHDYRRCPHFIPQHRLQTLRGSFMIFLDLEKRIIRAVRSIDHRDSFELWNCEFCWQQFIVYVIQLNQDEEIVSLFAEFNDKINANTAIKVVDGVRRNLEAKYECSV